MATLRQLIYDNEIHFKESLDYYAINRFNGSSGIQGNSGPTLEDSHYNVKHNFVKSNTEFTIDYEMSFERRYETQGEYYPIIMTTIRTDESNPYSFANVVQVGEKNQAYYGWWGPDGYYGNANYNLNDYWGKMKINSNSGYFEYDTYELSQGNEGAENTKIGFDAMAKVDTVNPQYSQTIGYYLNNNLRLPPYLTGPSRTGNREFWDIFSVDHVSMYQSENTPRIDEIDTNIPVIVFENEYYSSRMAEINQKVLAYTTDGDLTRFSEYISDGYAVFANNYVAPSVIDGTQTFQCYSDIFTGYWDEDSVTEETSGTPSHPNDKYRYLQVWVAPTNIYPTPRVSLYKARYGNELRCNIKIYGDLRQYKYSVDGGNNWTTVEKEGQEPIELPWTFMYYKRTNEKGWLSYDKNHGGNMLLFASEALCDDGSPFLAEDYGDKSFYYGATNETGTVETSTEMATTYMASGFQRIYICDRNDIRAISQQLYDTQSGGIWEDIKKGVEMYGENPINAVAGLTFFPFDLTTCFRNWGDSGSIWFGGYALQNVTVKELSNFNGYIDIGSIQILESFPNGDYRNYEPYCTLAIYLPFIGLQTLKMNKYVGKTLSIRYYVDVLTGGCIACLFADGILVDYFNGSMGVQLPISLTDYASFTGSQIQNLTELGSAIVGAPAKVVSGAATGGPAGAIAGGFDAMADFEKSMFALSSNAMDNFNTTKGASTSMINQYLPNYVYVIFSIIETEETSNLMTLEGRRSNASGTVGSFSGYLQVESVNLKASGATESEKQAIKALLASGIYI